MKRHKSSTARVEVVFRKLEMVAMQELVVAMLELVVAMLEPVVAMLELVVTGLIESDVPALLVKQSVRYHVCATEW